MELKVENRIGNFNFMKKVYMVLSLDFVANMRNTFRKFLFCEKFLRLNFSVGGLPGGYEV